MALPSRKKHPKSPSRLPADFLKTVGDLFSKQFKKEAKGATFLVYGDLYPNEVILCVSMTNTKSLRSASMHISSDLAPAVAEKPEKVTEALKGMVDVAASWFAQGLQAGKGLESVLEEMADLDSTWQELEWEGSTLFVKLNKTNYALERAADDFLKKSGFDPEDDEDAEDELDELLKEAGLSDEDDGGEGRGPLQ